MRWGDFPRSRRSLGPAKSCFETTEPRHCPPRLEVKSNVESKVSDQEPWQLQAAIHISGFRMKTGENGASCEMGGLRANGECALR
jgi:hypothetical protein